MTLTTGQPAVPSLEIRLFGGFDVRIDGRPLPPLRLRREQWLLALLVLRQDRDTARSWLAAALWPDNDEPQALFYLRKSLSNLRQALGQEAARLLSPAPRTVRLDMTGAFADVIAFDAALKELPGTAPSAAKLAAALAFYSGPLLPDCPEEWAAVERNHREQTYLKALETLGTHFAVRGEPATAIHWLRLLVAADPYRESAYSALMQALADCGDQAAMTVVYQELRSRLRQDLNAAPAPETEALYRQLTQRKGQSASLPSPAADAPPNRRHLPVPLSDLIGREEEITEILDLMEQRRLVTLVGAGGIGKTRLAIAAAEAALSRFDEGVWFVDLAPISDANLVPHATAKALGIAEQQGRSLSESLVDALASRTLLLVLDNCEHLAEACAELAHCLLSACPAVCMMATSRQALNVMGEQVYRVPSLPVPPLEVLPHGGTSTDLHGAASAALEKDPHFLMEYEAIRLFVDRAIRVNSAFRLHRRNASAVVEICRQLDGIPLAIEMAAARLRSLSVGEIQDRLADRFRLLTSGNRGVLPRQQTLRAAIDWSYDQLAAAERDLFCRLAVFAGGWTWESAASVCADAFDLPDLLAFLVDKSLVLRREEEEEGARYGMLESIRQYALERLEAREERAEIRRRHRDYFLTLAETAGPKLAGPERAHWLAVLDVEHDNMRQGLRFCRDEPEAGEPGLRMGAALSGYWIARGHLSEGRALCTALLSHPGAQTRSQFRSDALNGGGMMAYFQSDYGVARAMYDEGLAICRELDDRKGTAHLLGNLGNVTAIQGDYVTARELHEESLTLRRALEDRKGVSANLNSLGNIAKEVGDYEAARKLHEESLVIKRELGDRQGLATSLNNLGILAEMRCDLAAAGALFAESLKLHRELGLRLAEASNLAGLGNVALGQGDYLRARSLYEESLTIRQKLGDSWGSAISLQGLAETASLLGDLSVSLALHKESLALRVTLGDRQGIALSLKSLASVAQHSANHIRAVHLWGAMSALHDICSQTLAPDQRLALEEELTTARGAMGETAFASAWAEGRSMTMEQAVEYARTRSDETPS